VGNDTQDFGLGSRPHMQQRHMKLLMILAGLLMSAQAYSLLWEEVKANPARYRIESPGTHYNVGAYKRFVDFDGDTTTCIAGDQVYGGTIQKCMAHGNDDDTLSERHRGYVGHVRIQLPQCGSPD
jgi:hypothetical protein